MYVQYGPQLLGTVTECLKHMYLFIYLLDVYIALLKIANVNL